MPSTTVERYTLKELRKDAARLAELTASAKAALDDAVTIANRVAVESVGSHEVLRFTFAEAIRKTAGDISQDIVEGETTPKDLAEYAADLVKFVELATSEGGGVDA